MTRRHASGANDARLGPLLRRAEQALARAKAAVLKPLGLTLAQFVALDELEKRPGITAATLARACLVTPQAMMGLLKTMEEQGLMSRSPHERHSHVLELKVTSAGREALHAARTVVGQVEGRALAAFSESELDLLRALLTRLGEGVDAE